MERKTVVTKIELKGIHRLRLKIKKVDRLIKELLETMDEINAWRPK